MQYREQHQVIFEVDAVGIVFPTGNGRVANRTGLARGKTPLEVERKLLKSIPPAYLQDAHHWLILHGRYTCIARTPRCGSCVIEDLCEYRHKTEN